MDAKWRFSREWTPRVLFKPRMDANGREEFPLNSRNTKAFAAGATSADEFQLQVGIKLTSKIRVYSRPFAV
jgi:hypothetical protein